MPYLLRGQSATEIAAGLLMVINELVSTWKNASKITGQRNENDHSAESSIDDTIGNPPFFWRWQTRSLALFLISIHARVTVLTKAVAENQVKDEIRIQRELHGELNEASEVESPRR